MTCGMKMLGTARVEYVQMGHGDGQQFLPVVMIGEDVAVLLYGGEDWIDRSSLYSELVRVVLRVASDACHVGNDFAGRVWGSYMSFEERDSVTRGFVTDTDPNGPEVRAALRRALPRMAEELARRAMEAGAEPGEARAAFEDGLGKAIVERVIRT
jgi:hypothetical protein